MPPSDADGVLVHGAAPGAHVALRAWDGHGAVRLLGADPARATLRVERAGPLTLADRPVDEACDEVARLHARLHVAPLRRLRPVADVVAEGVARLSALPVSAPLPHRLVEQAVSAARDLLADDVEEVVVHGDLHPGNVLASRRDDPADPWLAVAPLGLRGDRHAEPPPVLWTRWDEAVATGDVRAAVRRRFHALVDGAGLDEDRARAWVVVRAALHALDALDDDRGRLTRCVTVAKAVED